MQNGSLAQLAFPSTGSCAMTGANSASFSAAFIESSTPPSPISPPVATAAAVPVAVATLPRASEVRCGEVELSGSQAPERASESARHG